MADPPAPGALDLDKVFADGSRCPSCHAFARVVPTGDHRWMCGICGAPRIVLPGGERLPTEAELALAEAATAKRQAALARVASVATGVPAAFTLLLAVALGLASLLAAGVLVAAGVGLAILAARASRRASTERKRLRGAVEHAYDAAITALLAKNVSPAEVAEKLRIPEADVETALAVGPVRIALPVRVATPEPAPETVIEAAPETERKEKA